MTRRRRRGSESRASSFDLPVPPDPDRQPPVDACHALTWDRKDNIFHVFAQENGSQPLVRIPGHDHSGISYEPTVVIYPKIYSTSFIREAAEIYWELLHERTNVLSSDPRRMTNRPNHSGLVRIESTSPAPSEGSTSIWSDGAAAPLARPAPPPCMAALLGTAADPRPWTKGWSCQSLSHE